MSAGRKFNCVVTGYNNGTGELTFNATPDISGSCKFGIMVRSGEGTGIISSNTLETQTFTVEADEFAAATIFANGGNATAFSDDFLASYYTVRDLGANSATWKRWYRSADAAGINAVTASNIPAWSNTMSVVTAQAIIDVSLTPLPMSTGTDGSTAADVTFPWGNGLRMTESIVRGHLSRMWWEYSTAIAVNALIFYQSFPGTFTEYVKFEVVASNDKINFVRIPTVWGVTFGSATTETYDTFHLKHDRVDINGKYAWVVTSDMTAAFVSKGVTASTWATRYTNKYFLTSTGTSAVMCIVRLVNTTAYKYYGFGNVGSDTPYSSNSRVIAATDARTYARMPFGTHLYTNAAHNWAIDTNTDMGCVTLDADRPETLYPWARSNGNKNFCLPQKCAVSGSPPTVYKYWRIRATSAFLGACGASTKVYFWKLGLYRDAVAATADTYGLSSNNYIQQWTNVVAVSTSNATPTSVTAPKKDQMCVSLGDWTRTYSTSSGGVSGLDALQNNAVAVAFQAELACIQFTLDVVGEIGAIRFPDNMYYDANVRGGTFILEAATAAASSVWVPMVATSSGKYLGRDGILDATPVASGVVGNVALATGCKIFTITPAGAYSAPTGLTNVQGTINSGSLSSFTVDLVSYSAYNTILDFTAHISPSVPTLGSFVTNCTIISYSNGSLSISTTVLDFTTNQYLTIFVRSGTGSGYLEKTLTIAVTIVSPSWSSFILWNGTSTNKPGWELQSPLFARTSNNRLSDAYTAFMRAVVDDTMYTTLSGSSWSSSTGSAGNMVLKSQFFGNQSDLNLIGINPKIPIAGCWIAPVAKIVDGISHGIADIYADNGTLYRQRWGFLSMAGFIRWGYKFSVTARAVGFTQRQVMWQGDTTWTLSGFSSNAFTSGTFLCSFSNAQLAPEYEGREYRWIQILSPAQYTHYELRSSSHNNTDICFPPILSATYSGAVTYSI